MVNIGRALASCNPVKAVGLPIHELNIPFLAIALYQIRLSLPDVFCLKAALKQG
jgi:hypothetical protein